MLMSDLRIYKILVLVTAISLLAASCGASVPPDAVISTAVAQTVQAGESPTADSTPPTLTPQPELATTLPPALTPTSAPTLVSAPPDPNCARASLVSENPPDNTMLQPGEYFWKTWTLQNTGTCTWTPEYKLIFWSGELMGGLTSYPLPEDVAPNEQKDISIYLQAPATVGTFAGYWRLQSPWAANFGVGPYDEPIYVQVVVSDEQRPDYGVTGVTYELIRNPPTGCPTNVRFTINATITTNGPAEVDYRWVQSDGNSMNRAKPIDFTEAGSVTVTREWMIGRGDSPNPRWAQIIIEEPDYQEFGKLEILNTCP
jgi:hypothetical protein